MSDLKARVIPFPTKRVITTFHFIDGKSISSISSDVAYIEHRKQDIRDFITQANYTIYHDFIVQNQYITHITFDYENLEKEKKDYFKKATKTFAQFVYIIFMIAMISCFVIYTYFSIFKK